jgi:hypothetical protein
MDCRFGKFWREPQQTSYGLGYLAEAEIPVPSTGTQRLAVDCLQNET